MIFSEYVRLLTEEEHSDADNVKDYIVCKTDEDSERHIIDAEEALYAYTLTNHVLNDKTWRDKQSTENHETALHILNFAQEKYDAYRAIIIRQIIYQTRLKPRDEKKIKELLAELKHANSQRVADKHNMFKLLTLNTVPYATQVGNSNIKCLLHYTGPIVKPEKDKTDEERRQSLYKVIYTNVDEWLHITVCPKDKSIISAYVCDLDIKFIKNINKKPEYNAQRVNDDCIVTYAPNNDAEHVSFSLNENDFVENVDK